LSRHSSATVLALIRRRRPSAVLIHHRLDSVLLDCSPDAPQLAWRDR